MISRFIPKKKCFDFKIWSESLLKKYDQHGNYKTLKDTEGLKRKKKELGDTEY